MNNLGIFEPKPFSEITDSEWLRFFEVNVMSGVRLSRFYLPGMLKRNWGRIVFISSESAVNIPIEMIHYGVTKTAQILRLVTELCFDIGSSCLLTVARCVDHEGRCFWRQRLLNVATQSCSLRSFFRARFRAKACFTRRLSPGFR